MRYETQDIPAGKRFDTTLPKAAFFKFRRAPVAAPPQPKQRAIWGIVGLFAGIALVAVVGGINHPVPPTVHPSPTPISTPRPAAIAPVPRAKLVLLPKPVPRAKLLATPWDEITAAHLDETHVVTMPYGSKIHATLRGFLASVDQLPQIGKVGDMYVVGTVPWIFTTAPGATMPTWIDP